MLDYSRAALKQIEKDFKYLLYYFTVMGLIIYLVYVVYALATDAGLLPINLLLGGVTLAYLIYYVARFGKEQEEVQSAGRRYRIFKLLMKAISLITTVYGIYNTASEVSVLSVIFAGLMAVAWVLQIVFEAVSYFVRSRLQLIIEGIEADVENMIRPITAARDFARKIVGKEPTEKKEPSKMREMLESGVLEIRIKRAEKKAQRRLDRRTSLFKRREDVSEKTENSPLLIGEAEVRDGDE